VTAFQEKYFNKPPDHEVSSQEESPLIVSDGETINLDDESEVQIRDPQDPGINTKRRARTKQPLKTAKKIKNKQQYLGKRTQKGVNAQQNSSKLIQPNSSVTVIESGPSIAPVAIPQVSDPPIKAGKISIARMFGDEEPVLPEAQVIDISSAEDCRPRMSNNYYIFNNHSYLLQTVEVEETLADRREKDLYSPDIEKAAKLATNQSTEFSERSASDNPFRMNEENAVKYCYPRSSTSRFLM
jgi:hypothetical protein